MHVKGLRCLLYVTCVKLRNTFHVELLFSRRMMILRVIRKLKLIGVKLYLLCWKIMNVLVWLLIISCW